MQRLFSVGGGEHSWLGVLVVVGIVSAVNMQRQRRELEEWQWSETEADL